MTGQAPLKTLFVIFLLNVLLLGHLADEPGEPAPRRKRYREGRELILCAGNYQAAAAIEFSQGKPDDFLMSLLTARNLFSLALLGLFRIGAQTPGANGDHGHLVPVHLSFQSQRE